MLLVVTKINPHTKCEVHQSFSFGVITFTRFSDINLYVSEVIFALLKEQYVLLFVLTKVDINSIYEVYRSFTFGVINFCKKFRVDIC